MIDTRHHPTNVIRQARRRSAPSHEMKAAHRADPAFWKAQMNIHQRVQKYEDEEEDSSDEYDDDFDLNIPAVETTKLNERNTPVAKRIVSPQKESNPPERKKSFSNVVHPRSVAYNTEARNSNNLFVRRQLSSMEFPAQRYSFSSRNEDALPALTPQEAIRLVMERNNYLSDTERTEDPIPLMSRKASLSMSTKSTALSSVHSSSTNETSTNNTVTSHSSQNRTAEGKRVLALKKKKIREDTHPTTSKNKNYHQKNSQSSRHQGSPTYRLPSERRKEREAKQRAKSSHFQAEAEFSRLHEDSKPNHSKSSFEHNQKGKSYGFGRVAEATTKKSVLVEVDDNTREESHKSFQSAAFFEKLSNTKSPKRSTPRAFAFDISESDFCSDSESNRNEVDRNDVDWHEDNTQRPSNRSTVLNASHVLEKEDEEEDDTYSLNPEDIDDKPTSWKTAEDGGKNMSWKTNEEEWGNMSWKTAKTSKSVLSKYSKYSSVELWMKNMEEAGSVNIDDDDIYFFDAIQEAGRTSSSNSVSTSDGSVSNDDPAVNTDEGEGWRGKITNFVGYTIGALTGSRDDGDDSSEEEDAVGTIPAIVTPEKPAYLSRRNSSMGSNRSANSNKTVPSRELEIIRKCQALMTSQRNLMETRERERAQRSQEDIRLQRMEDMARAKVRREVIAYREMMEGLGKGDKLAPLDRKIAAQDYDDRLSMGKTLEDQEMKNRMHERNMYEMDNVGKSSKRCGCTCIVM